MEVMIELSHVGYLVVLDGVVLPKSISKATGTRILNDTDFSCCFARSSSMKLVEVWY